MGIFQSFLQGGFECSTHKNADNVRVDLVASTGHDRFVGEDYRGLKETGIRTVRESARWHVIERTPGVFDFDSLAVIFDAAQNAGMEVILDLMHFRWPDFVDVFSPRFVQAFERFAGMTARFLRSRRLERTFVIPVNEISFLAWAGGERGLLNPHPCGRGTELKRQLAKAAIAASQVLREELPEVCLASAEPVIHVVGRDYVPGDRLAAERHRLAMFEASDMLTGRCCPELGGKPEYLDIVGVNFHERNQWVNQGERLVRGDTRYRPFHQILVEVGRRYRRPVFVSETGTEEDAQTDWFRYVSDEVRLAIRGGVAMEGICLYPIAHHPGWDDDCDCQNGLFDFADEDRTRPVHLALAQAIEAEQRHFEEAVAQAKASDLQLTA